MFIPASTVDLGSLASCPRCGGLVSLYVIMLGVVCARHLTGDRHPASCPRRGPGWATGCYEASLRA